MFSKFFIVVAAISATALAKYRLQLAAVEELVAFPTAPSLSTRSAPMLLLQLSAQVKNAIYIAIKKGDFIVYRDTSDPAGNPSQVNCNAVLGGVVRNCPYRGKGKINPSPGYFTFTLDPNAGACSSDVQPGS
ncbi:hypothetical protein BDQ17DRAFT_1433945 [Cyathus striatus]|nr:hypothetical protein BDQ17DRAFT_1433945 [Cyathus striatus]